MKITKISSIHAANILRQYHGGEILALGMIRSAVSIARMHVVYAGEQEPEKLTSRIQYVCAGKGKLMDGEDSMQIFAFQRRNVLVRISAEIWFEVDLSDDMTSYNVHQHISTLIAGIRGKANLFGEPLDMLRYVESVLRDPMDRELKLVPYMLSSFSSHPFFSTVFKLIADLVEQGEITKALRVVGDCLNHPHALVKIDDHTALYFGIKSGVLQLLLLHVQMEKEFADKKIFKYHAAYHAIIAGAVLKAYAIRIEILKERVKQEPELQDELDELANEYNQLLEARKEGQTVYFLKDEEKKEIRELFKKAVKFCHPDIVGTQKRQIAQEVFGRLKNAFDRNDIRLVREIYEQVRSGVLLSVEDDTQSRFVQQSVAFTDLYKEYEEIVSSDLYRRIKDQEDYDEYFKSQLVDLEKEIEKMVDELKNLKQENLDDEEKTS